MTLKELVEYVSPVPAVVVAELNLEKSVAVRQPNVVAFDVRQLSAPPVSVSPVPLK